MAALQNAQQALVSALRREDTAVRQVQRLQSELAALQDLLTANQRELQRNQMVMKFRNAEVDRRRVCHMLSLRSCCRVQGFLFEQLLSQMARSLACFTFESTLSASVLFCMVSSNSFSLVKIEKKRKDCRNTFRR